MKSNGLWLTCGGHSLPSKGISWPLSGAASCYGGDAPGSTWLVFASRTSPTSLLHSFRPYIRFADCRTSFELLLEIGDCRSAASFGATAPVRVNSPLRVPRQSMGVLHHVGLALHRFRLHLRDAGRAHRSPRGIFGELKEYCPQPPRQAPCDRHRDRRPPRAHGRGGQGRCPLCGLRREPPPKCSPVAKPNQPRPRFRSPPKHSQQQMYGRLRTRLQSRPV